MGGGGGRALAIDDLGASRYARSTDAALGFADHAVGHQQIAGESRDRATDQMMRALARRMGRRSLNIGFSAFGRLRGEGLEHGHTHGSAHLDLFADQRLRAVGHGGIDLDATIHRPRMHHQCIGLGISELALVETEIGEDIPASMVRSDPFMRSRCRRSIMTISASCKPSRMSRMTFDAERARHSVAAGSMVRATRTFAPNALSRMMLERAHPRMQDIATDRRQSDPRSVPCCGGWSARRAAPVSDVHGRRRPALMTEPSTFCARSSTAPDAWWRTTRISGCIAFKRHRRVDQRLALLAWRTSSPPCS